MIKEMNCTTSQVRSMLAPYAGEISAEEIKKLDIITKYGIEFSKELRDAADRENIMLIVNLAADDRNALINEYLVQNQKEKLDAAIKTIVQIANVEKVLIIKAKGSSYIPADKEMKVLDVEQNPVLREESALYYIERTGELRSCPLEKEYPSQGLYGQNCITIDGETLCRIYAMAKGESSSKLVIVKKDGESWIAEVPTGTGLGTFLTECNIQPQKNVLIGGVLGKFVGKDELDRETIREDAIFDLIWILGEKDCLADITFQMAEEAKEKSCGKCVLCREGTWHISDMLKGITEGKAKREDLEMILDIAPLIEAGAFCHFGQKMAKLFVSSMEKNRSELEAHFMKKTCSAGVCKAFAKLVIDPTKCNGCTDCAEECSEDAISGKKGFIHMIDPDLCENCGKCIKVCEENAIVMQDGTIRIPKKLVKVGKFK